MLKAYRAAISALGVIVGVSFGLVAVLIPLDMALRALGWGHLPWLSEGVEYAIFTGVFLAAPWALAENAHVRVELLSEVLPDAGQRFLERALCVVGIVVCAAMIWTAFIGGRDALEFEAMIRRYLTVPEWWLYCVFGVAMALTGVEFALRLFGLARTESTVAGG